MYSYIDDEDQMGLDSISHQDSNVNVEDDKKEVQDILQGIDGLKQRLEEIQQKCRHSDTDLKFIKTNDKQELRWVCLNCAKIVGFPTPAEVKIFLK